MSAREHVVIGSVEQLLSVVCIHSRTINDKKTVGSFVSKPASDSEEEVPAVQYKDRTAQHHHLLLYSSWRSMCYLLFTTITAVAAPCPRCRWGLGFGVGAPTVLGERQVFGGGVPVRHETATIGCKPVKLSPKKKTRRDRHC